jgi:predicted dehydrogenase
MAAAGAGRRLKLGIVGAGEYATAFLPLFQKHPLVEEVVLAEKFPERRRETAAAFKLARSVETLEDLLKTDVDAVAICTQRWMHGPQAIAALKAGKHVYSAVPTGITVEEVHELVETVKKTGLTYMLGETSYYYPSTIYCRQRWATGDFGKFIYGEGEYLHDMTHGFYDAYQRSGGDAWKSTASFPPILYPTHSVSLIQSVTGSHFTSVSCLGYEDAGDDGVFLKNVSQWGNSFSSETALFRTSDGGMARINEFRRLGHPGAIRLKLIGTAASFEDRGASAAPDEGPLSKVVLTRDQTRVEALGERLVCQGVRARVEGGRIIKDPYATTVMNGMSDLHDIGRLSSAYFESPGNYHEGSHPFLVSDFVEAVARQTLPTNNVWVAARYALPGIVAHESAKKDGETMKIPDFGDPPRA